jgi:hypothetical protein
VEDGGPTEREAIDETLERVKAAREELTLAERSSRARVAADQGRAVIREVLAERQFREHEEPEAAPPPLETEALESLWQRTKNWFGRLFSQEDQEPSWFVEWLKEIGEPVGKFLEAIPWKPLGVVLLGVLAAVLIFLAVRRLRSGVARSGAAALPAGLDPLVAEALRNDARHFLLEGGRLLERGNLREAVRAYYIGVLSALHRRRVLKLEPFRTNWEYVERLRPTPELHAPTATASRTFDSAWYGHRAIERERVLGGFLERLAGEEAAGTAG